jgi:hypothetical protein
LAWHPALFRLASGLAWLGIRPCFAWLGLALAELRIRYRLVWSLWPWLPRASLINPRRRSRLGAPVGASPMVSPIYTNCIKGSLTGTDTGFQVQA